MEYVSYFGILLLNGKCLNISIRPVHSVPNLIVLSTDYALSVEVLLLRSQILCLRGQGAGRGTMFSGCSFVRPRVRLESLWTRYPINQFDKFDAVGDKDELVRLWDQKVKVQDHPQTKCVQKSEGVRIDDSLSSFIKFSLISFYLYDSLYCMLLSLCRCLSPSAVRTVSHCWYSVILSAFWTSV